MPKISMLIPDAFLKEIDRRAADLNVNRTAFILMSLTQKFQQDDLMNRVPEMLTQMEKLELASSRLASMGAGVPIAQTHIDKPKD